MAKIKVTQVRSQINRTQNQKRTLIALGLRELVAAGTKLQLQFLGW